MVIEVLRITIVSWMIAFMPSWPVLQSIFNTSILLCFFFYLLYTRPHRSIVVFTCLLISECCILTAYICTVILAIFDKYKMDRINTRATLGKIMSIACIIIMYIIFVMMVVTLISVVKEIIIG